MKVFRIYFFPIIVKSWFLRYKFFLNLWISEQCSAEWSCLSKIFMAENIYNQRVLFNYQQKLHTLTFTNTKMDLLITVFYKTINIWIHVRYELAEVGALKCQNWLVCRAKQNKPQLLKLFLQFKDIFFFFPQKAYSLF